MHSILVPIDRSQNALRALDHAIELARRLGNMAVHVVHVHESPLSYARSAAYVPETDIAKSLDEISAEILQPAVERLRAAGVPHESAALSGNPAEAIVRYAQSHGCAQIVMGTRGTGPVASLPLGSVANKVLALAHVPLTLVK